MIRLAGIALIASASLASAQTSIDERWLDLAAAGMASYTLCEGSDAATPNQVIAMVIMATNGNTKVLRTMNFNPRLESHAGRIVKDMPLFSIPSFCETMGNFLTGIPDIPPPK